MINGNNNSGDFLKANVSNPSLLERIKQTQSRFNERTKEIEDLLLNLKKAELKAENLENQTFRITEDIIEFFKK